MLAQISGSGDWPEIYNYWTRRVGLTGSWPRALAAGELALNLWPVAPRSVNARAGKGTRPRERQPRALLGTPALVTWDTGSELNTADNALARAVATWFDELPRETREYPAGVEVAPPVVETWARGGRLVSRRMVSFGVEWALPPVRGIELVEPVE